MNVGLINKVRRVLMNHAARTALTESFETQKIDLDAPLYPPVVKDLPARVPIIARHIEIKPHVVDLNPESSFVKIGWNLFVLGTERMFLGTSIHESVEQMNAPMTNDMETQNSERYVTPRRLIDFIIDILNEHNQDVTLGEVMFNGPQWAASKPPPIGLLHDQNRATGVARYPH